MLVPNNEPFFLIELLDKIPLEKTGFRNPLFPIRNTNAQLNSNVQIEYIETWDKNIYIGTSDGSVIHFIINKYPDTENKFINGTLPYYKSECQFVQRKTISDKKPINKIIVIPSESILLVLCDNTIIFLDSKSLNNVSTSKISPIKNVLNVCTNEAIISNLQICIAKKHSIEYINFDHGVHQLMELPHNYSNCILQMRCYSNKVCIADNSSYNIFDITTGESISLFSYNQAYGRPLLNTLDEDEFMFVTSTAQGMGLGVFVSSRGDATRGTLQWQYYPNSIAYQYPYILALMDDNTLDIHNILDQRLIQRIHIPKDMQNLRIINSKLIFNNNNQKNEEKNLNIKILLYSNSKLYALTMKPIDFQLKEMMNEKYVNYALFLLEHNILKEEYQIEIKEAKLRQYYRNAGYVLMNEMLFDDALEFFQKGNVSPIILINLFEEYRIPSLVTSPVKAENNEMETDSINALIKRHLNKNYKDIDETTKESFSQAFYENAKNMLMKYLKYARNNKISSGKKQEIDTTLLKLYVESNNNELYNLIKNENHCGIEESIEVLKEKNKYYAMGLLYESKGLYQKALDIWIKIESKQLKDLDFPGIRFIVDFISNVDDKELVWKYSKWVLKEDQQLGAKIFMSDKHTDLDANSVVSYLNQHWNEAALMYLEYLVKDLKSDNTVFHTNLGLNYINSIIKYTESSLDELKRIDQEYNNFSENQSYISYLKTIKSNKIVDSRLKFINFINESDYCNVSDILKKINSYDVLMIEKVYLYSKSYEHEKALKILLYQLNDYVGAEEYCHNNQKKIEKQKNNNDNTTSTPITPTPVVDINENTYLQNKNSQHSSSNLFLNTVQKKNESLYLTLLRLYMKMENRDLLAPKIIKVLNTSYQEFPLKEVLDIIPLHWSVNMLNNYLTRSLKNSVHVDQQTKIIKNIVQGENKNVKFALTKYLDKTKPIIIDNNSKCSLCDNEIFDDNFIKTSDGNIVHFNCYNKNNK
ncbi:hypothetical protein BCR32DRAFT_128291 [Anaeromyces robustus]|uniref:CNH domain-containing protein n=1 Tax=Anaeromyces robustus TaxID=1754192 RepID=A0A1Y1XFF5_9FUNG|nr:hypothetical protein BCR32DRAFT_128291 [Anaeromyces robustus]|eukprot:ORX84453.1 hypothetical protein BCR32DRAFT_128291 [Anaeromyces robustus]